MAEIIITGGTFDKDYDPQTGELGFSHIRTVEDSAVTEILTRDRLVGHNPRLLMTVDSLDMTDKDRETIIEACRESRVNHIVITHGTDTMVESAKAVATANIDKTIVFTGAMRPFRLGGSDAATNLGSALGVAQTVSSGVYLAMSGQILDPYEAVKNHTDLIFEKL